MTDKQEKMKFIADKIGDDYKRWEKGNTIFLTAPTGSGKSHFIIKIYMKWILEQYWRAKRNERPEMDGEVATYYRVFVPHDPNDPNVQYIVDPSYEVDFPWGRMREDKKLARNEQLVQQEYNGLFPTVGEITCPKILYLVNRKVLKEQIEEQLENTIGKLLYKHRERITLKEIIKVETYQHYEEKLKQKSYEEMDSEIFKYDVIILDEAHYFLTDSNFNTSSIISFDYFGLHCKQCLKIFMSATFDELEKFIYEKEKIKEFDLKKTCIPCGDTVKKDDYYEKSGYFRSWSPRTVPTYNYLAQNVQMSREGNVLKYKIEKNYDYIQFAFVESDEELVGKMKKGKWLIFVESIGHGKKLLKRLEKKDPDSEDPDFEDCDSKDCVFIDAKYKKDVVGSECVNELKIESLISKRIVIATAVLDNGVSFHDLSLRNIVIAVDTKDEFIQMLGRKRSDGKEVNLYVYKRSKDYFKRRLIQTKQLIDFHYRYTIGDFSDILPSEYKPWDENGGEMRPPSPRLLDEIFKSEYFYECITKMCFTFQGNLAVSPLSMNHLWTLQESYENMIEEMENDPWAFVKVQLSWLGINFEEIKEEVEQSKIEKDNQNKDSLIKILEEYISYEMGEAENKKMKEKIRPLVCYFIQDNDDFKNILNSLWKKDRTISVKNFNKIMSYIGGGLPFEMRKTDGSHFKIFRTDTE